jgi:hypothetical protein
MQIIKLTKTGKNFKFTWPGNQHEIYTNWVEYQAIVEDGEHTVRIGFGKRWAYGSARVRVIVWVDGYPQAEFFSADDFEASGDVLSELKIHSGKGESMCRYMKDAIPERYTTFNTVGLPARVNAKGVHNAWAAVANISDHRTMIALAALKRLERA